MNPAGEIVFQRRGLAAFYYVMAFIFPVMGILFLLVGVGEAIEPGPWSGKLLALGIYLLIAVSWMAGAPSMWSRGKAHGQSEVRFGPSDMTFRLLAGKEYHVAYDDIVAIKWNPGIRVRALMIETRDMSYHLDQLNSPQIGKVANLLGERCVGKLQVVGKA
jgi:hypothetical protein